MRNSATHIPAAAVPALLGLLLIVDSLHFIFARALLPHLAPVTSAFVVLVVGALEMFVFNLIRGGIQWTLLTRNLWFFAVVGILVALSTNLNYAAVAYIDAGTAALLGKTSILFGLALSLTWLRERLTLVEIAGALLALFGVFVITFQPVAILRIGSLFVLTSTFLYALHTALVKRFSEGMDFANFFLFRLLLTSIVLFMLAVGQRSLVMPSAQAWWLLLLVGSVDVVLSRGLFYLALRRMQMSLHTIILTLSPVISIGWALLLFRETPGPQQLAGGLAVLGGISIVLGARLRKRNSARVKVDAQPS